MVVDVIFSTKGKAHRADGAGAVQTLSHILLTPERQSRDLKNVSRLLTTK